MERTFPVPAALSLVEQVRRLSPPVENPPETAEQPQILADGYCRLSPVQPYSTPLAKRRAKRVRIILYIAIAAAMAVALYHLLFLFMGFRYFITAIPNHG
ncbi:MAG: hypothetical protein IJT94_04805 [Oscillibacter sp.]|nr:hypothetical protein [Oscillibacter sp.]